MIMGAPSVLYDVPLTVPGEVKWGHALADRVDTFDLSLAVMAWRCDLFFFAELWGNWRGAMYQEEPKLLQSGWRRGFDVALYKVLHSRVIHADFVCNFAETASDSAAFASAFSCSLISLLVNIFLSSSLRVI